MARGPALRRHTKLWRQVDAICRQAFPGLLLLLGLFLAGVPLGLPGQAALRPAYAMTCVYFWTLYRPASLPIPFVAFSGLVLDLTGLTPVGLWAVLLLLLQAAAGAARRHLAPARFTHVWAAFIVAAVILGGLDWMMQSLLGLHLLPPGPAVQEVLLAAALYPALAALLIRAHRSAAAVEHA
jgi:rod shape-determining protein MreD